MGMAADSETVSRYFPVKCRFWLLSRALSELGLKSNQLKCFTETRRSVELLTISAKRL